jgi:site-specific DNA recombinase
MNSAIYARVSSEGQAKDGTIQSQMEALREYAQANQHEIIVECLDDGYSGADLNRPGLDQLRDIASEGLIEAVLVLSPDRLSRKQAHQIILLEEFKKRNVQVNFISQPFGDSAEDQLMLSIQGAIAEYERAKILDRTRRGTQHAVKNGQVMGSNPPYGYRFVRKSQDAPAHYAIDPDEAEIVKLVYDCYVNQDMSCRAIAKQLEQDGFPSRSKINKWWPSTINAILKNETYTGIAYMNKTKAVVPGKHPKIKHYRQRRKSAKVERPKEEWIALKVPAIIGQELWQKAQKIVERNSALSPRNNSKHNYLLRGLVVCGHCGSMAPGHVSNAYTYYSCGAKRNKNLTTKPHVIRVAVSHKKLDKKVWQGLVQLLDDPQRLQEQLGKKAERQRQLKHRPAQDTGKLEKELEKLQVEEKRLLDAYREGVIDLDELREQKAKINARLKLVNAKLEASKTAQEGLQDSQITFGDLEDLSAVYKRAMSKADFVTRAKIANLLINRVKLYPDRAVVEGNIPVGDYALRTSSYASPVVFLSPYAAAALTIDRISTHLYYVDSSRNSYRIPWKHKPTLNFLKPSPTPID